MLVLVGPRGELVYIKLVDHAHVDDARRHLVPGLLGRGRVDHCDLLLDA